MLLYKPASYSIKVSLTILFSPDCITLPQLHVWIKCAACFHICIQCCTQFAWLMMFWWREDASGKRQKISRKPFSTLGFTFLQTRARVRKVRLILKETNDLIPLWLLVRCMRVGMWQYDKCSWGARRCTLALTVYVHTKRHHKHSGYTCSPAAGVQQMESSCLQQLCLITRCT